MYSLPGGCRRRVRWPGRVPASTLPNRAVREDAYGRESRPGDWRTWWSPRRRSATSTAGPGGCCYRGFDVTELAGTATFEEVACLLQRGAPPGRDELAAYRADLAAGQALGPVTRASLDAVARAQPPMAALRTLASLAGADDPNADDPRC